MNNFLKGVIEETFKSKKQQRLFYAKANDTSLPKKERKKWGKWASEFSSKTDFDEIPNEVKEERDDIQKKKVNTLKKGDIMSGTDAEVTWVGQTAKTPKGKTRVDLKYPKGNEKTTYWGTHTEVGVKKEKEKEEEVDEIVDANGNIGRSKKPANFNTKGITDDDTLDNAAKKGHGMMGTYGTTGVQNYRRYWGESDMSKSLGYEDTLGNDENYDQAKDHFEDDLGLDPEEAEDRMSQMGYDKKLPDDKVRLVENPKKFMEEYIESILNKKTKSNDLVSKQEDGSEEKEINPIILKQINALKNSMDSHKLSMETIVKYLSDAEVNLKK